MSESAVFFDLVVGWLLFRGAVGRRFLMGWSLTGAAIILVPTFGFMSYWMAEPGFTFIFEFPMVLAPSVVVPLLIFLNFLLAWGVAGAQCPAKATDEHSVPAGRRIQRRLEAESSTI